MLLKNQKAKNLAVSDIIFGAEIYDKDVRYNTFRVLEIKKSDEHDYQLNIRRRDLTCAEGEEVESVLTLNSNSDVITIVDERPIYLTLFVVGFVLAGLIFLLTYPYFLNCY